MKHFLTLKLLLIWSVLIASQTIKAESWTTLYQSDFTSSTDGWGIYKEGDGEGTFSIDNGRLEVQITNGASVAHAVQLNQSKRFELIKGVEYRMSFYVISTSNSTGSYLASMQQASTPYAGYTYQSFTTTTTGESKSFKFTIDKETSDNIAFVFNLGNNGANTLYFSDIKLEKSGEDEGEEPDPDPTPENLFEPTRPVSDIYSLFTDYTNGNKIESASKWADDFSVNLYTNSENKNAYKLKWPAEMGDHEGAALFNLAADAYLSPDDLKKYEYIHFDVWANTSQNTGYLQLGFRDSDSTSFGDNEKKKLESISAQTWKEYDIPLSSLLPADNTKTLQTLLFQRTTIQDEALIYIDNIYLYNNVQDSSRPSVPAYLPPATSSRWGTENVVSVFSDSYTNKDLTLSFTPEKTDYNIDYKTSYNTWEFENTQNVSISGEMDVTDMKRFHIDVWTEDAQSFQIKLNDSFIESDNYYTSNGGIWTRIDVELPNNISTVNKIEIIGNNTVTYFVDNIYFYKPIGEFDVDIFDFNKRLGKGVNIGNTFEMTDLNAWDFNYIDIFNNAGISHIRLPINLEIDNRSQEEAPYSIKPEFLEEIRSIIDATLAKGMKIIIDFHHHDELKEDPTGQWNRFLAQWEQVAEYFQYYPEELVFELLNEPTDNLTPALWNDLIADGLEVVRKTNPTRPVVIGTAEWGGTAGLVPLILPENDNYLIVSIHYYNPFNFTHQGEEWMNNIPPVGTEWLDRQEDRDEMEVDFAIVDQFLAGDDRPITVGEFGAFSKADIDSRVRWTTYLTRYFDQKEWSYTIWAHKGNFFDASLNTPQLYTPLVDALLKNPMPNPFDLEISIVDDSDVTAINTLYDSKDDNFSSIVDNGTGAYSIGIENNQLQIYITNGGNNKWDVQMNRTGISLKQGSSYRVSFSALSSHDSYRYEFQLDKYSGSWVSHSGTISFTPTTEKQNFSFLIEMSNETDEGARLSFNLGSVTGTNDVILYFEDILIEEVEITGEIKEVQKVLAAPAPTESTIASMTPVYSSTTTDNPVIDFTDAANVVRSNDVEDNEIIQFTNYTEQNILFPKGLYIENGNTLHFEILAGSPFPLTITVINAESKEVSMTYDLPSHSWYSIDMDISNILNNGKGGILEIRFSGGIGIKRKLYIDHIYIPDSQNVATWNGSDSNWNNDANWSTNKIPNSNTNVILSKELSVYPILEEEAIVNNITFSYGAELGNQHLLTYNKAFVEFDFSSEGLIRDRYYFMTAPLQDMISGDFFFGGKPDVWVRYAQAIEEETTDTEVTISSLNLTKNLPNYKIDLNPGFGFAYRVVGEDGDNNTQTNIENNENKLLLPRFENEKDGNNTNSIYYNATNYGYNQHEVWHTDESTSYFYYFYSDDPDDRAPEDEYYDTKVRTKDENNNWLANRFITEAVNGSLILSGLTADQDILMGNPFMSHLNFIDFYNANLGIIENYFKIYNGNAIEHYYIIDNKVYSDNGTTEINATNALIAPMQAFFIKAIDVSATSLYVALTPAMTTTNGGFVLKNNETDKEEILSVTLNNDNFASRVVLLRNEEVTGSGVPKLFSNNSVSEIFILQDNTAKAIAEITQTSQSVDLRIRNGSGNMSLTISGISNFENTEISLYDALMETKSVITKEDYTLNFTHSDNLANRFSIGFSPLDITNIDQINSNGISVYSKNQTLVISSNSTDLIKAITIYNTQGILMDSYHNLSTNSFQTDKILTLGVYLMKVETEHNTTIKRVIVNN